MVLIYFRFLKKMAYTNKQSNFKNTDHQLSSQANMEVRPQIFVQCQLTSSLSTGAPDSTKASDVLANAAQKREYQCAK